MKIDVKHVAKLANLAIPDSQIKKLENQLSSILDHIAKLQKVDTEKVSETSQVTGLENVIREDTADSLKTLTQEEALSGTTLKQNGLFKVKGVLQNE